MKMFEEVDVAEAAKVVKKPRLGRTPVAPPAAQAPRGEPAKEKRTPTTLTIGEDPDFLTDAISTGKGNN